MDVTKDDRECWQMMAFEPSSLNLVPGIRLRVIDANLQGRKAALQLKGTAFGTFSGVEFSLDSPVDLKSKSGRWKFVGSKRHVDVPRGTGNAMSYCESGFRGKGDRPVVRYIKPRVSFEAD